MKIDEYKLNQLIEKSANLSKNCNEIIIIFSKIKKFHIDSNNDNILEINKELLKKYINDTLLSISDITNDLSIDNIFIYDNKEKIPEFIKKKS
jgi:hypothetical protein